MRDGRLLVRVTAPPVDRAANDAVITLLAKALDRPRASVTIEAGAGTRNKAIAVSGVTVTDLRERLSAYTRRRRT